MPLSTQRRVSSAPILCSLSPTCSGVSGTASSSGAASAGASGVSAGVSVGAGAAVSGLASVPASASAAVTSMGAYRPSRPAGGSCCRRCRGAVSRVGAAGAFSSSPTPKKRKGFVGSSGSALGDCRGRGCGLFGPRDVLSEDHLRQRRLGGLFLVLQRLRLHASTSCGAFFTSIGVFSLGGRRLREEQGLELLHLALLFLLLRDQRAAHIVLFQLGCGGLLRLRGSGRGGPLGARGGSCFRRCRVCAGVSGAKKSAANSRSASGSAASSSPPSRISPSAAAPAAEPWVPLPARQWLPPWPGQRRRLRMPGFPVSGFLLVVIAALHLVRHLRHTGAEKWYGIFPSFAARSSGCVFSKPFMRLSFFGMPYPSLRIDCGSVRVLLSGALALDLIQNDASRHRDVEAVHAGALCGHIQPHHAVAELLHQLRNAAALAAQHQCDRGR